MLSGTTRNSSDGYRRLCLSVRYWEHASAPTTLWQAERRCLSCSTLASFAFAFAAEVAPPTSSPASLPITFQCKGGLFHLPGNDRTHGKVKAVHLGRGSRPQGQQLLVWWCLLRMFEQAQALGLAEAAILCAPEVD